MLESASVLIPADQLGELTEQIFRLIMEFQRAHRGQRIPGSRPVQLQIFGSPVLDGVEVRLNAGTHPNAGPED